MNKALENLGAALEIGLAALKPFITVLSVIAVISYFVLNTFVEVCTAVMDGLDV